MPDIKSEVVTPGLEPFVEDFLRDRLSEIDTIDSYISSGDLEAVRKMAHNWKGFCEPYGFKGLGELSQSLELAAAKNDGANCSEILKKVQFYLDDKKSQLCLR